jgi:hypothetical protein
MVDIRKYDRPRDGQPGWDEQVTLPDDSGDELIHLTRESFNALFADYDRAMLIIGTELAAEAIRREWCTEFEDFVRHLNTKLPEPIVVNRDVPVKISLVLSSVRRSPTSGSRATWRRPSTTSWLAEA